MDPVSGMQMWLDDGDGTFSNTSDTLLAQGPGAANVTLSPSPVLTVPHAGTREVWVVVNLLATAGVGAAAQADTYSFGIAGPSSLNVSGTPTIIVSTTAPPTSAQLRVIDFFVTDFQPLNDVLAGGAAITITGSGFISPVTVRIDGVVCPGTPIIGGGGTMLTGLTVPNRISVGKNLNIDITSGGLPAEVLTQKFEYKVKGSEGGERSTGSTGCTGGHGAGWMLALFGALGVIASRRRRTA
jgi:hypothetical protein